MRRSARKFWRNVDGSVAPVVALSLTALIASGGIAFDYARMASLDTELQQAADQAALAGATQLDGKANAASRAVSAAQSLVQNRTYFGNDGGGTLVQTGLTTGSGGSTRVRVTFYSNKADAEAGTNGFSASAANADTLAKYVQVEVVGRSANFAFTPIVAAMSSGVIEAAATAGLASAICKVPPVMMCNPDESSSNTNESLPFTVQRGAGLRLITGNADAPGNFGWLQSGLDPGASALATALGYNSPPGDCQPITGVTTETGMSTSVLNAYNTRFDVFANGNQTCPSQGGGTCSPALDTRKDLVCQSSGGTSCSNDGWDEASKPYRLPNITSSHTEMQQQCTGGGPNRVCVDVPVVVTTSAPAEQYLPTDGTQDPSVMGFPRDLCHMWPRASSTCGGSTANHVKGNGDWDRDAYFRVNYKKSGGGYWTSGTGVGSWRSNTGLSATASRWDVYQWELAHLGQTVDGVTVNAPQLLSGNKAAFSRPVHATGIGASSTQADRRRFTVAVLNCQALNVHGKTTNVPVPTWLDVFLVEPAQKRPLNGPNAGDYTLDKDVYVEEIGEASPSTAGVGQVVRRDLPYLVR